MPAHRCPPCSRPRFVPGTGWRRSSRWRSSAAGRGSGSGAEAGCSNRRSPRERRSRRADPVRRLRRRPDRRQPGAGQEYNQKSRQWECARRDAGAQAGHDQTYKAGSQAADTTSDGTHTEPLPPIMPSPQRATPSCHTSEGSIAQPGLAGHGGVATISAKLAALPASSVIPPQWRVSGRRLTGESAGDIAAV
jgi:hypothetical protein